MFKIFFFNYINKYIYYVITFHDLRILVNVALLSFAAMQNLETCGFQYFSQIYPAIFTFVENRYETFWLLRQERRVQVWVIENRSIVLYFHSIDYILYNIKHYYLHIWPISRIRVQFFVDVETVVPRKQHKQSFSSWSQQFVNIVECFPDEFDRARHCNKFHRQIKKIEEDEIVRKKKKYRKFWHQWRQ